MTLFATARRLATTSTTLVLASLLLAGCGGDEAEPDAGREGGGPSATPSVTPEVTPGPGPGGAPTPRVGDVGFAELVTLTEPRLRMEEGTATPLTSEEDVTEWLPRRAPQRLVAEVDMAAATVGDGIRAYGLVLAVGCDAPAGYTLERVDGEVAVRVEKSLATTQCLVPTTWLAVVGVGEAG